MTGAEFAASIPGIGNLTAGYIARQFDAAVAALRVGIGNAETRELAALAEADELRAAVAAMTAERDALVTAGASMNRTLDDALPKLTALLTERDAARSERDAANRAREQQWKELQAARADAAAMREAVLKHFSEEPHQWQPQQDGEGNSIGPFEWMCGHCGGSGEEKTNIAHEDDCSYVDIMRTLGGAK